jgi:hypothetical protein
LIVSVVGGVIPPPAQQHSRPRGHALVSLEIWRHVYGSGVESKGSWPLTGSSWTFQPTVVCLFVCLFGGFEGCVFFFAGGESFGLGAFASPPRVLLLLASSAPAHPWSVHFTREKRARDRRVTPPSPLLSLGEGRGEGREEKRKKGKWRRKRKRTRARAQSLLPASDSRTAITIATLASSSAAGARLGARGGMFARPEMGGTRGVLLRFKEFFLLLQTSKEEKLARTSDERAGKVRMKKRAKVNRVT